MLRPIQTKNFRRLISGCAEVSTTLSFATLATRFLDREFNPTSRNNSTHSDFLKSSCSKILPLGLARRGALGGPSPPGRRWRRRAAKDARLSTGYGAG